MFRKYTKLLTLALLTAVMAVCAVIPADAAGKLESFALTVELTADGESFTYPLKWWQPEVPVENEYGISLPYAAKGGKVTVGLEGTETVVLDGVTLTDGQTVSAPAQGVHKLICDGTEYKLTVFYGSDIPAIYINTESGSMDEVYADKSHKEAGEIMILNGEKVEYNGALDYIKGRGNSTWSQVKKPFNIKLDEKADLFGMGKQKGWSLLANYVDVTLIKNKIAIDFADTVGLEFSSKSVVADLYINNEYIGNYTLIEKVEIDDNRVEITSLEDLNEEANPDIDIEECELKGTRGEESASEYGSYKYVDIPNDPEDITGGYLLEYEVNYRYDDEVSGFVSNYGQPIIVKSPEYASKAQVEYISGYYQEFEDAVLSDDGYNSLGRHYTDYIEIDSMVTMYLFQEYVKNLDAGITSFFLYKDVNEKFVASPVWDFDMAMGHLYKLGDVELSDANGYLATGRRIDNENGLTILSLLARRPEFREMAAAEWENNFAPKINDLIKTIDELDAKVKDSALVDKNKWTEGFSRTTAEVAQWRGDKVTELKNFMKMRAGFMSEAFSSDCIYVAYYANGASKAMLDRTAYKPGDTVVLDEEGFNYGEREFLGWNTQPDGSGTAYAEGDEVVLEDTLVLYAQWSKPTFFEMIAEFFANLFK